MKEKVKVIFVKNNNPGISFSLNPDTIEEEN